MLVKKNKKIVAQNRFFEIYFNDYEDKYGNKVNNFLVVKPKNISRDLVAGIAILPVFRGKIGLLKIYKNPIENYSWEIPKGFVEKDEKNKQAALRELYEETGLSCNDIQEYGYTMPDAGIISARIQLFLAENCKEERKFERTEIGLKELKYFSIARVKKMIEKSIIQDACTIITFYKYLLKRRRVT